MVNPACTASSGDENDVVPFPKPTIKLKCDRLLAHVASNPEVCTFK